MANLPRVLKSQPRGSEPPYYGKRARCDTCVYFCGRKLDNLVTSQILVPGASYDGMLLVEAWRKASEFATSAHLTGNFLRYVQILGLGFSVRGIC